ncbi:MAG: FixH family protein, partial [Bacteroidota bacterium]|nr:FixH family protein [Bacteroidota bacterium]
MNWGYKILIVYVVFVIGIIFLVVKSSSQKVDLVTTNYYDKELVYQQKIDAMNKVDQLSDTIKYQVTNGNLKIVFPQDFSGKNLEGQAVLYCPSDENKDITQQFSIKDSPVIVPVQSTSRQEYELQLSWQTNGTSYY